MPALRHDDHRIAERGDGVQVMLDQQHRDALGAQVAQVLADLARQRGVHAGHRLIQQQQLGFGHQGAADLQQFLLTAGQFRGAVVQHARQVQALRNAVGTFAQLGFAAAGRGGAQQRGDHALAGLAVP